MKASLADVTLQINISPGDINYAHLTVPALISQHSAIQKRLLVVDCCRPQKTKLVDPDTKFPEKAFNERVEKIVEIAQNLHKQGIVSDVYYLRKEDPFIELLSEKYLRGIYATTHSSGATANMSYWAGIELVKTRYILHYDGDLVFYQKPGYFWVEEALDYFSDNDKIVSATPRLCPPPNDSNFDLPSLHEGVENHSYPKYWMNDFLSTRHFLMDKERLLEYFPLLRGKILVETLLRKYGNRAFPRDPEIILFKALSSRGGKRLILKNPDAWFTHPTNKPKEYLDMLPNLIQAVANGECPEEQRGHENINIEAWSRFLNKKDLNEQ